MVDSSQIGDGLVRLSELRYFGIEVREQVINFVWVSELK
jgi:hypothetical protein